MVDVLALVTDDQLRDLGLQKNVWGLLDAEEAQRLYAAMPAGVEVSGGSAANTAIGVASLGGSSQYIGKVSNDQLGEVFVHDLRSTGVRYETPVSANGVPTGRCLIFVTPDAHRTMRPYLGAAHELNADDVREDDVAAARVGDVVDTTGAGDLYAAGFLFGLTHGESLARSGELGSLCAGEVISHVGARPQRQLAELVASS